MGQSCLASPGRLPESTPENSTHSSVTWSVDEDANIVMVCIKSKCDTALLSDPPSGPDSTGLTPTEPSSVNVHEVHPPQPSDAYVDKSNAASSADDDDKTLMMTPVELSPEPEISGKECYSGLPVAEVLQHHYNELMDEIDPEEVAIYLFRVGIIGKSEMESAANKYNDRRKKSNDLMLRLLRKLSSNPHWGYDAVVALKKAGVNMESIIKELEELSKECEANTAEVSKNAAATNTTSHVSKDEDAIYCNLDTSLVTETPSSQQEDVPKSDQSDQHDQLKQTPSPDQQHHHEVLPTLEPYVKQCSMIPEDEEFQKPEHCHNSSLTVLEDTGTTSAQSLNISTSHEQDENGNTKLHLAVYRRDVEMIRILVNSECAKSIINHQNSKHRTALHISTIERLPVETAELLKCGACDPYTFDKNKKTPLHYACFSGMTDLVKPILDSKRCSSECVNAPDGVGDTALHIATRIGCRSIVKLLRRSKAKPLQKNHNGETPIDIAQQSGNPELVASLQSRGISLWRKAKMKFPPLKRSASCTLPRAASETSMISQASQSQSEFNYD